MTGSMVLRILTYFDDHTIYTSVQTTSRGMLDELQTASDLFQVALDRYLNACLAIEHFYIKTGLISRLSNPIGSRLVDELSLMLAFETKIHQSKLAIIRTVNRSPDVVPISKLPNDILVDIFQQLVNSVNGLTHVHGRAIPEYPLLLSRVCVHWRQVTFGSPSLWSCIRINTRFRKDKRLVGYTNFHGLQAKRALMDICVADVFSTTPEIPGLLEFVKPFSHRIRSLEFRMTMYRGPDDTNGIQDYLLTECLKSSTGTLKRLSMITSFTHEPRSEYSRWFIESTSNISERNSLALRLSNEQLETALSSVSELWLEGLYFNWTSNAYRGLTLLRLENSGSCSIPESRLLDILASSPQLRWLDIGLEIIHDTISPKPIHLPHLDVLVDYHDMSLMRLVQPGVNPLTLSILLDHQLSHNPNTIHDISFKDFFSRANVTTLYSVALLRNTSDIHHLLSVAPSIRALALSYFELSETSNDTISNPEASLDTLFILKGCELARSALQSMIKLYRVKEVILWGRAKSCDENIMWKKQTLMDALSDFRETKVQYVPETDNSIFDRFLGPLP